MANRPQSGFTLVELMVSLSVAAILLGVGIPSFAGAIKNAKLNKPWGELRQSLFLARSEAVKGSRLVTVCARATDTTCGSDWQNGWLVFVENATPTESDTDVADASGGTVIRISEPLGTGLRIGSWASDNRTAAGVEARNYVRYQAPGNANWDNGWFVVCDDREELEALGVNIALTGHVSSARKSGDDVVLDVFGREVACPS